MGGHGALTLALRNPGRYRSVSAFAPIVAPTQVPLGREGARPLSRRRPRGVARHGRRRADRGRRARAGNPGRSGQLPTASSRTELKPELLEAACRNAGIPLTLRLQEGYDHSYYFISTFMEDHLRWHWQRLSR